MLEDKLLRAIDATMTNAITQTAQPYDLTQPNMLYEVGRRVGRVQGLREAKQALMDLISDTHDKDGDL